MTRPIRVAHVTSIDLTFRFLLLDQFRRLRAEGFEVYGISADGPWTAEVEAEGVRHITWKHVTRSWSPLEDARSFLDLIRILRRERFDLVHTHNPKSGILGRVAGRLTGTPVVVNTIHGLYATPDDPALKRCAVLSLEWLAARFSDLELYQSEEDLAWSRRRRLVSGRRGMLLGNGIDVGLFDPANVPRERVAALREELGIPDGALVVGMVGRLVAGKGYREYFEAANRIRSARPEVCFLAIGDLDLQKADAITPEELERVAGDVMVTGWRTDVRDLLAVLDVFVLASWREGLPRSAIEAAAMAKPLVVTDIRGCREVVRDGREGRIVPPRDADRLAAAIAELLDDEDRRKRLGAAARARALERFDQRKVTEIVVCEYRRLLRERGRLPEPEPLPSLEPRTRPARASDVPDLARLHREIPDAFLTLLGDRFLRRLYRALVEDPGVVVLVSDVDGRAVAFAAGALSVGAVYRRFSRRHGLAAAMAAGARLARPEVVRRMVETARYPARSRALPDAELMSIAVAPAWRSRGIGRELASRLFAALAEGGARGVKVSVRTANEPANAFYRGLGLESYGELTFHEGRPSNVWIYRPDGPGGGSPNAGEPATPVRR